MAKGKKLPLTMSGAWFDLADDAEREANANLANRVGVVRKDTVKGHPLKRYRKEEN